MDNRSNFSGENTSEEPEGPGVELDRVLRKQASVREEQVRLRQTADKLDTMARELLELLHSKVRGAEPGADEPKGY